MSWDDLKITGCLAAIARSYRIFIKGSVLKKYW